jgi:hypothetical protein
MIFPIWQSAGAAPGTKGLGTQVRDPSMLYRFGCDSSGKGYYFSSSDGGDTWQAETDVDSGTGASANIANMLDVTGFPGTGTPYGIDTPSYPFPGMFVRDQIRPSGSGMFDNGRYVSQRDVAINSPWEFVYNSGTGHLVWQGGMSWAASTLKCSEVVRGGAHLSADTFSDTSNNMFAFGGTSGYDAKWYYGPASMIMGTGSGGVACPIVQWSGTPIEIGLPNECQTWCPSLGPLIEGYSIGSITPPFPVSQLSDWIEALVWNASMVVVYAMNGFVQVIKSQDSGRTFTPKCWSDDNAATWKTGAHPGYA